jgi:hypothetical protein
MGRKTPEQKIHARNDHGFDLFSSQKVTEALPFTSVIAIQSCGGYITSNALSRL